MNDQLFARDARRSARRARPGREPAVPARRRRAQPVSGAADARRSDAAGAGRQRRRDRAGSTRWSPSCSASPGSASPRPSSTRAKQAKMAGYERVVAESPDRESASRADEYTRNFLQDEALPTIWQELAFHRRFVPEITLAEINALAERLVPRSEPAGGRVRAGSGRRQCCRPSRSSRRRSRPRRQAARAPTSTPAAAQTLMDAPPARGTHRQDDDRARGRHHRMDAVERRDRRPQADDAEGGPDPVPRDGAGRHVARERRRLHSPRASPTMSSRRAASGQFNAVDARQDAGRQGGRRSRRSSARSRRAWAAAARRRISRRCSS